MNNILKASLVSFLLISVSSCSPTASSVKDLLEKNPDILTNAIEKNPDKFMMAVQKAAQAAQGRMQENQAKEEEQRIEEEFKNPLKPELDPKRAFMGNKDAPITIVEYTDFQCPFCSRGFETVEQLKKIYGDKVRVLVKNLPLPNHPMAMPAAQRFEALMLQSPSKAFEFYVEVFRNQKKLDSEKYLDSVVKKVGGDVAKAKADAKSEAINNLIRKDMEEAQKFGIQGTPGFIVNGVSIRGAYPIEHFKKIIDRKLSSG